MAAKHSCDICGRVFDSEKSLNQHKQAKHPNEFRREIEIRKIKMVKRQTIKNALKYSSLIILPVLLAVIMFQFFPFKSYPPTTIEGHIEAYPPSRIMKEPIPESIQKHILEHVASAVGNRPGVLIQYNCVDFECEEDLIQKLESWALRYDYVFVAPYPKMDFKIALTKYGQVLTLDSYDETKIREFIETF